MMSGASRRLGQIKELPLAGSRRCSKQGVCSSHQTALSKYPSTLSTPSLRADPSFILIREIQALWSQNHDTEILRCNAVIRVDNAMTGHLAGYDRHGIQMLEIAIRIR